VSTWLLYSKPKNWGSKKRRNSFEEGFFTKLIALSQCARTVRHSPLHADEADYNQNTGEIDPRGNVHMTPHRIVSKN